MSGDMVYILHWEYPDKSGHGIELVSQDENKVDTYCDLLAKHTDKRWYVDAYPLD